MYTICGVVMHLSSILQTWAAYWVNLQVKTSIDRKEWDFSMYYYLQLVDTLKYIVNNILICIIKELLHHEGEGT